MYIATEQAKENAGFPNQGRTVFRMVSFASILTVLVAVAFLAINSGA